MIEDQIDHFLVAVEHLENAVGQARLKPKFGDLDRYRRIALAGLEDKGIARRNRHRAHPQGDHRREVERGDTRTDPQRLAHRGHVDPGSGALGKLTLQHMRQPAAEFDHFQPALDIALGVGDDLAVFAGEQFGQRLHIALDQALEFEHHPRAALGVHRGPGGLCGLRGGHCALQRIGPAQHDFGLLTAVVGIHHRALAGGGQTGSATVDEMVDHAHEMAPAES